MSEIANLRKLLNASLDILEEENQKAGYAPLTLAPVDHNLDHTNDEVATPRAYMARRAAIGAMQNLTGLIQPVSDKITADSIACLQTAAIAALSRSKVFSILAGEGVDRSQGLPANEILNRIEEKARFSEKNLPRFARLACALGWLKETAPDVFALTRPSLVLGTNQCAAAFFDSLALQNMRATPAFYDNATDPKTRASEAVTEAAWTRGMAQHLKPGQHVWEWFAEHPEEMEQFGMGMCVFCLALFAWDDGSFGQLKDLVGTTAPCVADYSWDQLTGTIVDNGGGRGSFSLPMFTTKANKDLKLVIQDRPEVVELAKVNVAENYKDFANRIECQPHDFFKPNPRHGKDVNYMMRWLLLFWSQIEPYSLSLHDWSDEDCVRILTALSSVMHEDSKIILIDAVVTPGPGRNTVDGFIEALKNTNSEKFELIEPPAPLSQAWDDAKTLRSLDMLMGAWFNARERTEAQLAAVADAAGLRIHKIYPARAVHWITELVKK